MSKVRRRAYILFPQFSLSFVPFLLFRLVHRTTRSASINADSGLCSVRQVRSQALAERSGRRAALVPPWKRRAVLRLYFHFRSSLLPSLTLGVQLTEKDIP